MRDTDPARWAAAAIFTVGAASDFLDGYLARRHAMTTPTGAWLDPLSDKLFVAVPAVVLSIRGEFPWWATAVIVGARGRRHVAAVASGPARRRVDAGVSRREAQDGVAAGGGRPRDRCRCRRLGTPSSSP